MSLESDLEKLGLNWNEIMYLTDMFKKKDIKNALNSFKKRKDEFEDILYFILSNCKERIEKRERKYESIRIRDD